MLLSKPKILQLMNSLRQEFDTAILLITHDLGVVNEVADDVAVMYAGRIVRQGTRLDVLGAPQHPYTQGLIGAIPARAKRGEALSKLLAWCPNRINGPMAVAFARAANLPSSRVESVPEFACSVPRTTSPATHDAKSRNTRRLSRERAVAEREGVADVVSNQSRVTRRRSVTSAPSMTSVSTCRVGKRWHSWVSRGAAKQRWDVRCCVWSNPKQAKCCFTVKTC